MPSGDGRWTELSSQNERVIRPDDPDISPATARWAELASSRERLVDACDPLLQRASGHHPAGGLRLVAGAA